MKQNKTVLFVCTGNTCRSPMAEGLARMLSDAFDFQSAGLAAVPDDPVTPNAAAVMAECGVDITGHKARPLLRDCADLYVPMTASHAAALRAGGIPEEKIRMLAEPVPDPYGGNLETYRACRDKLQALIASLLETLES